MLSADGGGGAGGELDVDTWVPGKPSLLNEIATELERFGSRSHDIANLVQQVYDAVSATSWSGGARDQYLPSLQVLPERLRWVGDAYWDARSCVITLSEEAERLCQDASELVRQLSTERAELASAEETYTTAAADYAAGFLTDVDGKLRDEFFEAGAAALAADSRCGELVTSLREIADDYHEACCTAAHGIDGAEPDELLDTDFASVIAEAITDGRIAGLLDGWTAPYGLDDPDLDGEGEYEFRGDEPLFPNGSPGVDDIVQGDLGDCWLLAVLAGMASQNPDAIEGMITRNPDGTYTITFADGERVTVDGDVRRGRHRRRGAQG